MIFTVGKGLSGFVAFTVLLAISTALAIYVYTYSANLYNVYKPRQNYVYGYAVCFNVSGMNIVLSNKVTMCSQRFHSLNNLGNNLYLCKFRLGFRTNVTIVYRSSSENMFINGSCIALLRDLPVKVVGVDKDVYILLEVKSFDPWSE